MTNTIAAIIISIAAAITSQVETNKTEQVSRHWVQGPSTGLYLNGVLTSEPDANPKSKTVTTKVELVKRLQFEWEGSARVVESRELISQKVQNYVAKEGWEKEGGESDVTPNGWNSTLTNWVWGPVTNAIYLTNSTVTNWFLMATNPGILWVPATNK
jgi:hypothetical protein